MKAAEIPQLRGLSVVEKLQLVEELWDEIMQHPEDLPIPQWHKDLLDQREESVKQGSAEFVDWETAKKTHSRPRFMKIELLALAEADLVEGFYFYESQQMGLGGYFLRSLYSDIESLKVFAGIHRKAHKNYHRLLAKRFPYSKLLSN